jgi:hypothetical protein
LQDGELVAQDQDLRVFVLLAHWPQAYQGEHARQGGRAAATA